MLARGVLTIVKNDSRYYYGASFGKNKLNQKLINDLEDEIDRVGLDEVKFIYAAVMQQPIFKENLSRGMYPTIGKCICYLKYNECVGICQGLGLMLDHGELWYRNDIPYKYIAQPYLYCKEDVDKLNELSNDYDFNYTIHGDSYHFYGKTFVVEVWNK